MRHDRRIFLPKPGRHCEINLILFGDAKIVAGQRVDPGRGSAARVRPAHEMIGAIAEIRILPEAVAAPVTRQPVAVRQVKPLGLVGVTSRQRIGGGEVATPTRGKVPESVPRPRFLEHASPYLTGQ